MQASVDEKGRCFPNELQRSRPSGRTVWQDGCSRARRCASPDPLERAGDWCALVVGACVCRVCMRRHRLGGDLAAGDEHEALRGHNSKPDFTNRGLAGALLVAPYVSWGCGDEVEYRVPASAPAPEEEVAPSAGVEAREREAPTLDPAGRSQTLVPGFASRTFYPTFACSCSRQAPSMSESCGGSRRQEPGGWRCRNSLQRALESRSPVRTGRCGFRHEAALPRTRRRPGSRAPAVR